MDRRESELNHLGALEQRIAEAEMELNADQLKLDRSAAPGPRVPDAMDSPVLGQQASLRIPVQRAGVIAASQSVRVVVPMKDDGRDA